MFEYFISLQKTEQSDVPFITTISIGNKIFSLVSSLSLSVICFVMSDPLVSPDLFRVLKKGRRTSCDNAETNK